MRTFVHILRKTQEAYVITNSFKDSKVKHVRRNYLNFPMYVLLDLEMLSASIEMTYSVQVVLRVLFAERRNFPFSTNKAVKWNIIHYDTQKRQEYRAYSFHFSIHSPKFPTYKYTSTIFWIIFLQFQIHTFPLHSQVTQKIAHISITSLQERVFNT